MSSLLRPQPERPEPRRDTTPRPRTRLARGSDLVVPVVDPEAVNLDVGDSTELIPRKRWEKRKARLGLPLGAVAAFAVAGAITFFVPTGTRQAADLAGLDAEADAIASALDGTARAGHLRAEGIAASPMLRAAILTDAATVADMVESEYRPTLGPGETLELVQVRGAAETVLMRLPAEAAALAPMGDHTTRLEVDRGGHPVIVVSVPVAPYRETAGTTKISGRIVLSLPVDLGPTRQRLGKDVSAASITGTTDAITLVRGAAAADPAATVARPIATSSDWKLGKLELQATPKQVAAPGPAWRDPVRYASCGMGAALLLVFGMRRWRRV